MKKLILLGTLTSLLIFTTPYGYCQKVGINGTGASPHSSAILDVDADGMSPKGGLLLPRMTTTERNAISGPAESLWIYNTTTQCYEGYNASAVQWVAFGCLGCQLPVAFSATAASGINFTSFSANWTASPGATAYYLDVSTSSSFSSFVTGYANLSVGNVITYNVSANITCNTSYYYRVRANNSCGTTPNSNTISVTTTGLLGSFSANAVSCPKITSFTADWTAAGAATKYYLDVSISNDFSSFVTGYNNLDVGNVITYTVNTNLTCNTTYYFRVRANNSCQTSASSNIITLTTAPCCGNALVDSRDSKSYNTVVIGTQCWMKENLDYGTYVAVANGGQAGAGTQKYCQNYSAANDNTCPIGGLYEWDEMMDGAASCNGTGSSQPACSAPVQGICPCGWHIPSHDEWTLLEKNCGSNPGDFPYDETTQDWRGTNEGANLKETGTTHWNSPNSGPATNSTGFTALPGGFSLAGGFSNVHIEGGWWSSTESGGSGWHRHFGNGYADVYRHYGSKAYGFSVRCVAD